MVSGKALSFWLLDGSIYKMVLTIGPDFVQTK